MMFVSVADELPIASPARWCPGGFGNREWCPGSLMVFSAGERCPAIGGDRERFDREVQRLLAYPVRALVVETTWLAMETGGWRGKITWTDIEITNDPAGRPQVSLSGQTARIAAEQGVTRILVSITHTHNYAAATAIGLADE